MMKTADLRTAFLDFFKQSGHEIVPSASLIPTTDPTLLFATAGMVPFKDVFTGKDTRPYQTAASCQKCVRAGGKHNDLDQVGYTARHHTFFEMLGNFSFGAYFKEKAILFAWTLLTKNLGLPADRLWITIYHDDEEAFSLWKKIAGLPDQRIIRIATADNFWAMGDTGPCGPCSEIFYDHGPHIAGGPPGSAEQDGDRFVELWNLVFMSYELTGKDQRIPLARPSIDTGMGIERAAAVLQGVHDNFETDTFKALIQHSADLSHTACDGPLRVSHRVIVDHIRSISFLIADGLSPSHEGRGYVLRRILRRALRHVYQLGVKTPSQHLIHLVPTLIKDMGSFYPELARALPLITMTLTEEGQRFESLLERGMALLSQWLEDHSGSVFSAEKAFQLYDTYGFPLDMTQDILKERNMTVDEQAFDQYQEEKRQHSRQSWTGSGAIAQEELWTSLKNRLDRTVFMGYQEDQSTGAIQWMMHQEQEISQISKGQEALLIVDQSPFYGESGGQVGDHGWIQSDTGKGIVFDTQKKEGFLVHHIRLESGSLCVGQAVRLTVDMKRRAAVTANHSATHLMHAALRHLLGEHVTQKGSLVTADKLRFDFSHSAALTQEEIDWIEDSVNKAIWQNDAVQSEWMQRDMALSSGALAFFGEKYEEQVRLISMGTSKELCGGTHVNRTGQIGSFKIVSEGSVASGIRRIEAVTQAAALSFFQDLFSQRKEISSLLKVSPLQVKERIQQWLSTGKKTDSLSSAASLSVHPICQEIGQTKLSYVTVAGQDLQQMKQLADRMKKEIGSGVVLIMHTDSSKVTLIVGVTQDLTPKWDAVFLLKSLLPLIEGTKGGGRADLAQGGGHKMDQEKALVEHLGTLLQ